MASAFVGKISEVLGRTPQFFRSTPKRAKPPAFTTLTKDNTIVARSHQLIKILGSARELDEIVLRQYLELHDLVEYKNVLSEVKAIVFSNGTDVEQKLKDEFVCFANIALKACVEGDLVRSLRATLEWYTNSNRYLVLCDDNAFKRNNPAQVRAAKKGHLKMLNVLYSHGFRIISSFSKEFNDRADTSPQQDQMFELELFAAMAAPVYLVAESKNNEGMDPIRAAFCHMQTCQELKRTMKASENKLDAISNDLKSFTVKMLDLCHGKEQVEIFLGQDDAIEGLSIKDSSTMPRVYQALQLEHREFVTHDNCQQIIRKVFFGEKLDRSQHTSGASMVTYCLRQIVLFPFFCTVFILAKMKPPKCKRHEDVDDGESDSLISIEEPEKRDIFLEWSQNLRIPINRLICQTAGYALFLVWILMTLTDFRGIGKATLNPNIFDILAAIWAMGYVVYDVQLMYGLSQSISVSKSSYLDIAIEKTRKFFSNSFFVYRFLGHFMYLFGIVLQHSAFRYEALLGPIQPGCNPTDPRTYQGYHAVRIAICLRGIGAVMIITQALQLFRLNMTVGSLYVAIKMCLRIVMSFIFTYAIISTAFALGLHYIMRYSNDICDENGSAVLLKCNDRFFLHQRKVGVYCSVSDSNTTRVNCPDKCWKNYTAHPFNVQAWSEACAVNNQTHLRPQIVPDSAMSDKIDDLDTKKNRFRTMSDTISVLFWAAFDPGHPEVIGCSQAITRYSAMALWIIYNVIVTIILLNLLVAMMNVAMNEVVENRVSSWKYHRTCVWMDYCGKSVVMPSPVNLFIILLDIMVCFVYSPCHLCGCVENETELIRRWKTMKKMKYLDLIKGLKMRYINDLEDNLESDTQTSLEKLERDIKLENSNLSDDIAKRFDELTLMITDMHNQLTELKKAMPTKK